jgi:uncharacterized protein YcbK (DUF882 family)
LVFRIRKLNSQRQDFCPAMGRLAAKFHASAPENIAGATNFGQFSTLTKHSFGGRSPAKGSVNQIPTTLQAVVTTACSDAGTALGRRYPRNCAVSACGARRLSLVSGLVRAGASLGLAGLLLIGANDALQTASAEGDTRTLSFHHLHTGENITITYKRDGRYDDAALKKLDWFMRDWRRGESVHMDPHLFDLLWETYREVGGKKPIDVICGYRAPGTNAMLRARSTGVAQNSQHINGQAIDFEIPGVPLERIRNMGLRLQRGGVGFYPTSGSPFVHLDTGSIRHWPRIARAELVKIFPKGRTVHIPSDGVPLPGYALALADVERRGSEPSGMSLEAARDAGIITASIERTAAKPKRSLLARIFRGDLDEDEQSELPAPKRARAPVAVASLIPVKMAAKPVAIEPVVPLPAARPKLAGQNNVTAALPDNMFDNRGIWRSAVETGELPPLPAAKPPFVLASADPAATFSSGYAALAYATETPLPRPARARPMGSTMPQLPATATVMPTSSNATVALKRPFAPDLTSGAQRSDSPWLRAAILTPSMSGFMTTTRLGAPHMRPLASLLHKPPQSLVMTFSADPHLGLVADRFSGRAVVFLATATFTSQTTASLR